MKDSKMLNWDALKKLGHLPEPGEEILWAGQPFYPHHYFNKPAKIVEIGPIVIFLALMFKSSIENPEQIPYFLLCCAIAFLWHFLFPFIQSSKFRRTAYVVTNERIFITLWRHFKQTTYQLRYDDFQRVTFVMEYPGTNIGTIYLMTGKDVGFWTYELFPSVQTRYNNFHGGERRQHPTLECVKGAEALALQIEKIRTEKVRVKRIIPN